MKKEKCNQISISRRKFILYSAMEEFNQNPFPSPVRIMDNRNIRAIIRRNDLDGNPVTAIHLVDHNYDEETNTFGERPGVEMEIDKGIFKGAETKEVSIEKTSAFYRLSFNMKDIWNILVLSEK
jgi:hypothetical protein